MTEPKRDMIGPDLYPLPKPGSRTPAGGGPRSKAVDKVIETRQRVLDQELEAESVWSALRSLNRGGDRKTDESPIKLTAIDPMGMINSAYGMVVDMLKSQGQRMEQESREKMEGLKQELTGLKNALMNPGGDQKSPLQHYMEFRGIIDQITQEQLKLHQPAPQQVQQVNTLEVYKIQIDLKRMDLEADERRRHWDAEQKERDRKFDFEMERWREEMKQKEKQWSLEFGLKRMELEQQEKRREKGEEMFGSILGAITDEVDGEMGGEGLADAARKAVGKAVKTEETEEAARSFLCTTDGCGTKLEVPDPVPDTLTCPKCKLVYELRDQGDA